MWWLVLPIAIFLLLHAIAVLAPDVYLYLIIPEDGIVEYATPILLLVAMCLAISILRRSLPLQRSIRVWLALFAIGCLYFAGEEVSWGQRIFGWETPENWRALNKQEETNLHNVAGLLDSKPKLVVSLGLLVGGILYPLSRRLRAVLDKTIPPILWPSYICLPAALCALLVGLPERLLGDATPRWLAIAEPGEVKELYIAMFLLLYAMTLSQRLRVKLRQWPAPSSALRSRSSRS